MKWDEFFGEVFFFSELGSKLKEKENRTERCVIKGEKWKSFFLQQFSINRMILRQNKKPDTPTGQIILQKKKKISFECGTPKVNELPLIIIIILS